VRSIPSRLSSILVGVLLLALPAYAQRPPEQEKPVQNGDRGERDVARIRAATEAFKSLDAAVAAGYAGDVTACLENPPQGGMGYHHQNDALLDDKIELERPEMLVYERLGDGSYRLNGVEYIVPFSAHPADAEPPTVMGQELKPAPSLRIWYRHVWVWLENPSGLFADWNPRVECRAPAPAGR
jgi:hypothetical protein